MAEAVATRQAEQWGWEYRGREVVVVEQRDPPVPAVPPPTALAALEGKRATAERLRPVLVIVLRRLTEAVELGGYELPAGTTVTPSIHLVHRDPEIYPEPERFLPERFLDNPPGTYTWIPFGGGIRRCLGASFAQFEMQVVLRELVRGREILPSRPASERSFRRAITETPRRDAEVVLA